MLHTLHDPGRGSIGWFAGPIAVGDSFIWEPHKPHARARCTVTRVEDRGSPHQNRVWSTDASGLEVWNDESRFREACIRA